MGRFGWLMMKIALIFSFLATCLLAMSSGSPVAAQFREMSELDNLLPGRATVYRVGDRLEIIRNGARAWHEVIAKKNGLVTFKASYGCVWRKRDLFSPPVEWRNCDGYSGTQKILATKASPWPLKAGRSFSYTIKGSDDHGNSWRTVQRCRVVGRFAVTTLSGPHDTYKVVCTDDWLHQVWYWSPALGEWVKYIRNHRERGRECDSDMLRRLPAASQPAHQ